MNNKKTLRYALSLILFVADIAHFIIPKEFIVAMPDYIPYHLETIYLTGLIELVFSVTLNIEKLRKISCYLLSAYFIAILPAHIHVSVGYHERKTDIVHSPATRPAGHLVQLGRS